MKAKAKKALSMDKIERKRTGGGEFVSKVDGIDEKLIAVLGNRATPLINEWDSDAYYNNESGEIVFIFLFCMT
jgi:hypothetical protein